jgi:hypothetical protein
VPPPGRRQQRGPRQRPSCWEGERQAGGTMESPQKRMCTLKEGPGGEEWRLNIYFFMEKPREESVLGSAGLGRAHSERRTP